MTDLSSQSPSADTKLAEESLILKGVGKIDGDGWKDTTRKGQVVFVWNAEKEPPYAPGQFPRIGCEGWSASREQYDFAPATTADLPAILDLLRTQPPGVVEKANGNRALPFARDELGRMVREAWVRWAKTQPDPKPSWLTPYDQLSEADKEADRQIGEAVARWTLIGDAATLTPSTASPGVVIPERHRFTGDESDLRMRFNEAIAGGPNANGDSGWIVHTNGHADDMERAIKRIATLTPSSERDAVLEEAAKAALGDVHPLYSAGQYPDGSSIPGSPYDRGRADAAQAIRALKSATDEPSQGQSHD